MSLELESNLDLSKGLNDCLDDEKTYEVPT